MHALILGGTGFVGLNVAAAFCCAGDRVTLFDKAPPPRGHSMPINFFIGDVRERSALEAAVKNNVDIVICGAAITAGPLREASDPSSVISVNLGALPGILETCRDAGVKRVINLSSASAYGAATGSLLAEADSAAPESLYAVTKFASEKIATRLAAHWGIDLVNVRLSAVFGPWERATGDRDTLSAQCQILELAASGKPALLSRPGERDWIYATDVAEAIVAIAGRMPLQHKLYNISTARRWSVLDWAQALALHVPGVVCRLVGPGEQPTVDLHTPTDRPPLATERLATEIGWRARFDMQTSSRDLAIWWRAQQEMLKT